MKKNDKKWCEVSYNLCGHGLNHYAGLKPTPTDLRKDGIKVIIRNSKILTFCEVCYDKYTKGTNK